MSNQASLGDISGSPNQEASEKENSSGKWKSVKIGNEDYFERYSGDTPAKGNEDYWSGDIKWLSNSEVSDEQVNIVSETDLQITEEGLNNCTAKIVPENSVILSCTASIGKVAINTEKMATNQQFNAFEIKKEFNPYFLANQLFYRGGELQAMGGSTTHNHLAVYVLEKFDLDKPPLDEQRRIASVLYNVDQAIQKTEEIIEQTQRVKKGLMQDLFTEGYYSHEEIVDLDEFEIEDSTINTSMDETTVGKIPSTWSVDRLGNISEDSLYGASKSAEKFSEEKPRYIRITDISEDGNRLKSDDKKSLSKEKAEKYLLEPGQILFARSGATVGKTYLYREEDPEAVYGGYLIRFEPNKDVILPEFLFYYTHSTKYYNWVERVTRKGAQENINAQEYSSILLPIPSLEEQRKIVETLEGMDEKISNHREEKEQLQRLKKGLMQDLLNGSVRTGEDVRVLDEVVEVEG